MAKASKSKEYKDLKERNAESHQSCDALTTQCAAFCTKSTHHLVTAAGPKASDPHLW